MRKASLIWVLPAACGAALLATADTGRAGDASEVGEMFKARCAQCHTVPDPQVRTDRAWLDQVNRTA